MRPIGPKSRHYPRCACASPVAGVACGRNRNHGGCHRGEITREEDGATINVAAVEWNEDGAGVRLILAPSLRRLAPYLASAIEGAFGNGADWTPILREAMALVDHYESASPL